VAETIFERDTWTIRHRSEDWGEQDEVRWYGHVVARCAPTSTAALAYVAAEAAGLLVLSVEELRAALIEASERGWRGGLSSPASIADAIIARLTAEQPS